jgi:hypothetical protein
MVCPTQRSKTVKTVGEGLASNNSAGLFNIQRLEEVVVIRSKIGA